ncbi:MAG: aminotransferase class V-fold PLP-dependent enzyme [Candidatus Bathyarchaeota archaeon]|nr:aminotransferase class V-fold PLP-dependent enzyme [Candidatus Bathyarchaeota archaeon]
MSIYKKLGVHRVVNASFALTRLGGSVLTEELLEAMEDANKSYVYMWDLIKRAGEIIVEATGAEAAWVTPGAFSALVSSAAACIAGKDPEKMRRLPDTTGMKNEIIIQRANRLLLYDRSMEVPGGKFVFVGDERWGCTPELMENAITDKTAAIHHAITGTLRPGVLSIEDTVKVAHAHGVPVILDAAGMTYPLDGLSKFTKMGVDLVCYGGKYVGGPNSTGFVQGRKDLIEALSLHTFIGAEAGPLEQGAYYRSVCRGYKLDRQEVVALIVAFKRWLEMDHEKERFEPAWDRARYIEDGIKDLPGLEGVSFSRVPPSGKGCVYHTLGPRLEFVAKTPQEVGEIVLSLRKDDPEIWVRGGFGAATSSFVINCLTLVPGDEEIIVERFKKIFG